MNKKVLIIGLICVSIILASFYLYISYLKKIPGTAEITGNVNHENTERNAEIFAENYCADNNSIAGEDQFLNNIKNAIINNDKISPELSSDKEKITWEVLRYSNCKIFENKEYYPKALEYLNSLNIPQSTKEDRAKEYQKTLDINSPDDDLLIALSKGDLTKLCPDKLTEICLNNYPITVKGEKLADDFCRNLCEYTTKAMADNDFFQKGVLSLDYLDPLATSTEYRKIAELSDVPGQGLIYTGWRIALAWRAGGKDMALKFCDNFKENRYYEYCASQVRDISDYISTSNINCEATLDWIKPFICPE